MYGNFETMQNLWGMLLVSYQDSFKQIRVPNLGSAVGNCVVGDHVFDPLWQSPICCFIPENLPPEFLFYLRSNRFEKKNIMRPKIKSGLLY
jgi:hypothetical protein